MDALVTDAQVRSPVAGLRALGRSGTRVHALAPVRAAAGLFSRFAASRHVGPEPSEDPAGFREAVIRIAEEHGPLAVYPGRESSLEALVHDWPELHGGSVLAYPGAQPLQRLRDKRALAAIGAEVGIDAPRTLAEGAAQEVASHGLFGPCIVKAAGPEGALRVPYRADSGEDLRGFLEGLPPEEPVLVQALSRGPLMALALVVGRDGGLVARFQQRAVRTWPPGAGPSSLAVSVAPDENLARRAARLLASAGYWGLAQLQFIDRGRRPALIDVNPRFYGSLPLALAAGVNLPAAWHAVAGGDDRPWLDDYRVGVSYRWLEADLAAAANGLPRRVFDGAPRPRTGAMWALDDPLASALMAARSLTEAATRRRVGGSG